ncbi:hypothetical protein AN933_25430 [Mycobacterium intracellulare subsp. chimaera]|nr:hypothetical protein AN933_25430 [Mycobacterium intracellulare subsp. chimaera]
MDVEIHRGALISALNTALGALLKATDAVTALTSSHIHDIELAEGPAGDDIAALLTHALRLARAAAAVTHTITEDR